MADGPPPGADPDALLPIVYEELRRLAAAYLRRERPGQTLQPTALVHEAYLRLLKDRPGRWQFTVSAWTDRVATWQDELRRKSEAGQTDLSSELAEGAILLERETVTVAEGLAAEAGDRHGPATSAAYEVDVDRELARFGAWYELFPRSAGPDPDNGVSAGCDQARVRITGPRLVATRVCSYCTVG